MNNAPYSINELAAFLAKHPNVNVVCKQCPDIEGHRYFLKYEEGRFFFRKKDGHEANFPVVDYNSRPVNIVFHKTGFNIFMGPAKIQYQYRKNSE